MNMPKKKEPSKAEENIAYFKLPLIEKFSKFAVDKLQNLTKGFCQEDTNIKIVFNRFKLTSVFSTKDKVSHRLSLYEIYKFLCSNCNASYIEETYRHISARIHEYLETDKVSNIYKRLLKNSQCKLIYDQNCLSILDSARTKYTIKICTYFLAYFVL